MTLLGRLLFGESTDFKSLTQKSSCLFSMYSLPAIQIGTPLASHTSKPTSVGTHGWLNGPIHVTVSRSSNHAIWASITLPYSLAVHTNKPQLGATPVTGASVIQAPALVKRPGRAALAGEGSVSSEETRGPDSD